MDMREVLHHMIDAIYVPSYARAGAPGPDELRQAVDDAYGYKPPEPSLTADEQKQLDDLLAKQRAADQARAEKEAGVEHTDTPAG